MEDSMLSPDMKTCEKCGARYEDWHGGGHDCPAAETCAHCGQSDPSVEDGCCGECARQEETETQAVDALDLLRLGSAENFEDTF